MKLFVLPLLALAFPGATQAQPSPKTQNIFIITTDGFRWREVFDGADEALVSDAKYVKDTALTKYLYWDSTTALRRKKLMPFFWNVIAEQGQLYGNRLLGNKMDVKNWYKISYPGYNEILTGYSDPLLIPNIPVNNRNINVLEYLNAKENYAGKVVVFSSWNIFPYILNEKRNRLPFNSGYHVADNTDEDSTTELINEVQNNVADKKHTRYDWLTFLTAREYIGQHHPKIVLLGLGETDEFAHSGRYDLYLQQAANIDKMIAELWYDVQTDPFYKDNTTFIITTDHGRGKNASTWYRHGIFTKGSGETWMALLGPGILPLGEMKTEGQTYQKQLAATIALLLGENFDPPHPVGRPLALPAVLITDTGVKNQQIAAK